MRKVPKFFICKHCGNVIGLIEDAGVSVVCCGENMTELVSNTSDGATEKHLPVITVVGSNVNVHVSTVDHPMTKEHHIGWVYLFTQEGAQRKELMVGDSPDLNFVLTESDKAISAYAYCNLHGLWKTNA